MDHNMNVRCSCPHHSIIPVFIILGGLVFLLKGLEAISSYCADILWPIAVIIIGFMKLFQKNCTCCSRP